MVRTIRSDRSIRHFGTMRTRTKKIAGEPLRTTLADVPGGEIVPDAEVGVVHVDDGAALRHALWGKDMSASKGTVCMFQGRGEFIEKHFETISELLNRGYAVAALDWRGQGGSGRLSDDPRKGHICSFDQYHADLEAFIDRVVLPNCPPPHFGLGNSMGGNILIGSALKRNRFEKVVVTSPLIDIAEDAFPRNLVKPIVALARAAGFGRTQLPSRFGAGLTEWEFADNPFTGDAARFERARNVIEAAPDLAIGAATFDWLHAALQAIDEMAAIEKGAILRTPVLIVAAGRDRIVSVSAARAFADRVSNASIMTLDEARHEILLERDTLRERFWAAFTTFVHDREPLPA